MFSQLKMNKLFHKSSGIFRTAFPKRNLQLHEYQAAQLVHQYRIPIPRGNVAFNGKEAYIIARKFGSDYSGDFFIKAQV